MAEWPVWWSWELELSPHLLKRMADRRFNEAELRLMLEDATGYHVNDEPGRWVVETRHAAHGWEVIVEPVPHENVLVVVTAQTDRVVWKKDDETSIPGGHVPQREAPCRIPAPSAEPGRRERPYGAAG